MGGYDGSNLVLSMYFGLDIAQGHTLEITCVTFSTDAYVVSGSRSGQTILHGLQQGTIAARMTPIDVDPAVRVSHAPR